MKDKPPGSFVLADASGVAKTVYGLLTDGFYSGDFVDLATILETGTLGPSSGGRGSGSGACSSLRYLRASAYRICLSSVRSEIALRS
jgi:hypothetical protein